VGGQSRRFGSDKAVAHVGRHSMASLSVRTLRAVADPVALLGGDGSLAARMGLPWRHDDGPGRGPLSGIASGLRWAVELGRPGLVVLACDLPLVTSHQMTELVSAVRPDLDAVVAETGGAPGVQPLCAWYATQALEAIEDALEAGRYSVREILGELHVEHVRIGAEEGGEDAVFLNVNTQDDLAEAIRRSASGGGE